jgi:CRISPR-associated endonuclease/helicase Cas3
MSGKALAHLREDGQEHELDAHLRGVASRAAAFAAPFGGALQAEIAGLWHDLGKYAGDFQGYLRGAASAQARAQAHVETDTEVSSGKKVDHSSAGALHAAIRSEEHGLAIAFAIAGHHAGLADLRKLGERLAKKQSRLADAIAGGAPPEILGREVPALPARVLPSHERDGDAFRRFELYTRMLFSALCDADFLDTEAFFDPSLPTLRGGAPSLDQLAARLSAHVDALSARASPTAVNRARAEIRAACRARAEAPPGVFTLTVPTGGGKTLSAMEFALLHAARYGLRRVIVALPFTAILDQSADVYRQALGAADGDALVLEHHASFDAARETARTRVACQNWDAPIVVTTNVQLLESLFARRTSKCRKLHNIAQSVIILDEAQTLPRGLLAPTTDVLDVLVRDYGCSLVLCTATQPALLRTQLRDAGFAAFTEIAPEPAALAARLQRVEVDWSLASVPIGYQALAEYVAAEPDVLAIVHRRADARDLVRFIDGHTDDKSTLHLSALMCPAHRRERLADIRARKERGDAVRVVATQLVEAGVDLDFPVVYRALAGLDALAQAAGRCNREGKLGRLGTLRVFLAETSPPPGILQQALEITRIMLRAGLPDLFAPETHTRFFSRLYAAVGANGHDEKGIQALRADRCFEQVADAYRIIDEDWAAPVVIPWDERARRAIAALRALGPSRLRLRELSRVTVTVNRKDVELWKRERFVEEIAEGTATVLLDASAYDKRFGLDPERVGLPPPSALVV